MSEDRLKEAVKELFDKYLNRVEESDSGYLFNPISIGCCRVMFLDPLNNLIEEIRDLSGASKNPIYDLRKE